MEACAVICRKGKRLCGYASRCQLSLFPVPIPVSPSTKSGFLCFFGLRDPRFRAFRAQNWGFCALLRSGTPVFWLFEHKIEVFVLFWPSRPPFSGFSSTKSAFLCALVGPRPGRWPGATGATGTTGATGAMAGSNGNYGNNQSNGNNRSNRNDGRDSLGC